MRGMGMTGMAVAMLGFVLAAAGTAQAGQTGEAACGEFFNRTGTQNLFQTVPPPQPVAVVIPGKVVVTVNKKKKKKRVVTPSRTVMVQPQYTDLQVGCTAASGDGDVADGVSVSATDANQTLVVDVLSSGTPTGRCDPGPLGQISTETNGDKTVGVKLTASCNYRSFGGTGQGACAKCYQVRVRFENAEAP